MTLKKRSNPAPAYKQHPPFNPLTGQFSPLGPPTSNVRLALFQVIEADTDPNYVVCQGWDLDSDPNCKYMLNQIAVAKPYSLRGTKPYSVGYVLCAAKVRTNLGDNPGVASVSTGQPASLSETINLLYDGSGNVIEWQIVEGGGSTLNAVELKTSLQPGSSATGWPLTWNSGTESYDTPTYGDTSNLVTVYDPNTTTFGIGHDNAPVGRGAIVFVDGNYSIVSGGQTVVIGKLDGSLSQGSSATVSVWAGTAGSESDTTVNITGVQDWLMTSGATAIASGKKVVAQLIGGVWYVTEAECP